MDPPTCYIGMLNQGLPKIGATFAPARCTCRRGDLQIEQLQGSDYVQCANKCNTYRSKREGAAEITNDSMRAWFTFVRIHAAASNSPEKISGRLEVDSHASSCTVLSRWASQEREEKKNAVTRRDPLEAA